MKENLFDILETKYLLVLCFLYVFSVTNTVIAQDKYTMPEPFSSNSPMAFTHPMKSMMNPNTWMQMMSNMMNPQNKSATQAMCAGCHQSEDLQRYQKQCGTMLEASWNQYQSMMLMPMQMVGPWAGIGQFMHPPVNESSVMSPEEYEDWYNKQQEFKSTN